MASEVNEGKVRNGRCFEETSANPWQERSGGKDAKEAAIQRITLQFS